MIKCNNCHKTDFSEVIDIGDIPIAHKMLSSTDEKEEKYPISLVLCNNCGLIQISNPIDPDILYLDFNYCFSSWKPQPHMDDEIDDIIKHAKDNSMFEIAANDGLFLNHAKKKGIKKVVGLEPNAVSGKIAKEKGIVIYQEMLNEDVCRKAVLEHGKFNVVVARQVLEHLLDIENFFRCSDILLKEGGYLFVDIPDIEKHIMMGDITVIWEEHVNYIHDTVYKNMLVNQGYELVVEKRYNYSGGITAYLAKKSHSEGHLLDIDDVKEISKQFSKKTESYSANLRRSLDSAIKRGHSVVLYGVGCRACTFVNSHNLKEYISFAVDDQKERQGKFMPGSKIKIKPSESIGDLNKKAVILLAVNQENEDKVKKKIAGLNKDAIAISALSPTDINQELLKIII